jgi:hypothetical protein
MIDMYWRLYGRVTGLWLFQNISSSCSYVICAGSYSISTVSEWSPMLPYVGLGVVPPAYPTRVRTTPGRLPNRESGPQNQPRAKVAVSSSSGTPASMGGISAASGLGIDSTVVNRSSRVVDRIATAMTTSATTAPAIPKVVFIACDFIS